MNINIAKEFCEHCNKAINIGQAIVECDHCNLVIHTKCFKKSNFIQIHNQWVCAPCKEKIEPRYNPFSTWQGPDTEKHYDDDCDELALTICNILEKCKSYSTNCLNRVISHLLNNENQSNDDVLSSLFLNIDGNATNFDQFLGELKSIKHNFTAIGLAETNVDAQISNVSQIPHYRGYYQSPQEGKKSGTGVALYVHESINVSIIEELSEVSSDIECLFLKTTNTNVPITFGVVYRPNDGNKNSYIECLNKIFDKLPDKNVYIMGDYNMDLFKLNKSNPSNIDTIYEDCFLSSGYIPLISTFTHERSNCKNSCIDNIFSNNTQSILLTGTLHDKLCHHLPIFQFTSMQLGTNTKKKNIPNTMTSATKIFKISIMIWQSKLLPLDLQQIFLNSPTSINHSLTKTAN